MGRRRFRHPRLPAHDGVHQVLPAPGGGRAVSASASAAERRSRCTPPRRQAHAELYMGLVETGVGLLPGGGGCKEMTLRAVDAVQAVHGVARSESVELLGRCAGPSRPSRWPRSPPRRWRRGGSACPRPADRITMNRERLLNDAKQTAPRHWPAAGYAAPVPRTDIPGARRERAGHAQTRRPHDARRASSSATTT